MNITKQILESRRAKALEVRESAMAQVNAQVGAIATIDHLLAVLDLPEPPAAKEAPPAASK